MYCLLIFNSFVEVSVLLAVAMLLAFTIRFFIASRRSLQETIKKSQAGFYPSSITQPLRTEQRLAKPAQQVEAFSKTKKPTPVPAAAEVATIAPPKKMQEESIEDLKATVLQQQKLLNGFLRQVELLEQQGKEDLELRNKHLESEIRDLEAQLDNKAIELDETRQKAATAEKMAARIEEVYRELDQLQAKMENLERQATKANNLALELEDTRQAYEQVHKDLQRKTEKFDEVFNEKQQLQQQFNALEDKFAEVNLHRQQLQKKVQFLQDLNADLQSVSDANKKLQTELRRVGELESMLNMISEERDYLLRKNSDQ